MRQKAWVKACIGQEYLPAYRQAGENLIKRMI
jgi:hypothetical protein